MIQLKEVKLKEIIVILSQVVKLRQCINNHYICISNECPFCGYKSKWASRIFRYNSKLKVGKSYCCGKSFKDLSQLKEELRYIKWHESKKSANYMKFEKFKIVNDSDDSLPF